MNKYVKRFVKSEMLKRDVKVKQLVVLSRIIGVNETKSSIKSKISRGAFSAEFLLQVLQVIGYKELDIVSPNEMNLKIESQLQHQLAL